jgi:heat shock protein HslJ
MKKILFLVIILASAMSHLWAKRINPNAIVNARYEIASFGTKKTAPKYKHTLQIDRSKREMYLTGAKTEVMIAAEFSLTNKVIVGKNKVSKNTTAAKKAHDAETLKIAESLKKANRFEKNGKEVKLYKDKTLLCTLTEEMQDITAREENTRVVIGDGGTMQRQATIEGTYRIIQQSIGGEMQDFTSRKSSLDFKDMQVSANVGCNTINGAYITTGNAIKFKQLIQTQMACGDELDAIETATTNNINQAARFRLESNKAFLDDASGNLLIMLERVTEP